MSRITSHSIADAPEASRPLLQGVVQFSPTGQPLNLHAQMAHSPAVLDAYVSIRKATATHGTLDPAIRSALMLATAAVTHNDYAGSITAALALRSGWGQADIEALRTGEEFGDGKTDSIVAVIREAAARSGQVADGTWQRAVENGWNDEQLAEAFVYLGLTVYTAYFLNYAKTSNDLPAQ
jgi:Carboxymuconolactone decarboxylase family